MADPRRASPSASVDDLGRPSSSASVDDLRGTPTAPREATGDLDGVPFAAYSTPVRDEWVDYNGHMNDVYYTFVCAQASEALLDALGLGAEYQEATGCTTYTVESHVRYLKEALAGDVISVTTLIVDATPKRLRLRHSLRDGGGDEVATGEFVYLHVDQRTGRVEPMPPARQTLLTAVFAAHQAGE